MQKQRIKLDFERDSCNVSELKLIQGNVT